MVGRRFSLPTVSPRGVFAEAQVMMFALYLLLAKSREIDGSSDGTMRAAPTN